MSIPNRQLPVGDALLLIDAIGPFILTDPSQPKIRVTLTTLANQQADLSQRQPRQQRVIDMHVADLMAIGPGTLIQGQLTQRHPKTFLQKLKISLDTSACTVHRFEDLSALLGPEGTYPAYAAWPMLQHLQCLSFATSRGTILIPCLNAWRFVVGTSSDLLSLSIQSDCLKLLTNARENSALETPDGRRLTLTSDWSSDLDAVARKELLRASTLHLSVPPGFSVNELPFLAWCLTDELVFQAMTRFYTSIVAGKRGKGTPYSTPDFRLPFDGLAEFSLQGVWLSSAGRSYFLAHHIDWCKADIALPQHITHTLTTDIEEGDEKEPFEDVVRQRTRKPRLDDEEVEVDSFKPPTPRLTTLHFGLRRNRFPHLQGLGLSSRDSVTRSSTFSVLDHPEPEQELSLGTEEPGDERRRKAKVEEEELPPPEPLPPPEQRPVEYADQFCDLLGVCEELQKLGIKFEFLPLGHRAKDDPTTLMPSTDGPAATWVGKGLGARRALIAQLTCGEQIAYALEWERLKEREYGKLLLCTAGRQPVPDSTLHDLLLNCARERGRWPRHMPGSVMLIGVSHRQPHAVLMSQAIKKILQKRGWQAQEQC